jgi:hypothetical protein
MRLPSPHHNHLQQQQLLLLLRQPTTATLLMIASMLTKNDDDLPETRLTLRPENPCRSGTVQNERLLLPLPLPLLLPHVPTRSIIRLL